MTQGRTATLFALLAIAFTSLTGSTAAPAAGPPSTVGPQIDVFLGTPTTFPAGEPFHIRHGWGVGATGLPEQAGHWWFELEVDGVLRPADHVLHSADPAPTTTYEHPVLNRAWVFNFPSGLSGVHTFTGRWMGPCRLAVEYGFHSGPCDLPMTPVDVLTRSLTVHFERQNLALGKAAVASNELAGNPASLAVDGSWWTYWNSGGFPPQWIEVDLGEVKTVDKIDLGITQLPDSPTVHRLLGRGNTADPWTLLTEFEGFTVDQQVLHYSAGVPRQLRYVRVETTSSSSWVAWREVEVYAAGG